MDTLPYQDPSLPIPQRVADLISRMTLPEKAGQMLQLDAQPGVEDLVLEKHVGSILHASPQRVLEALDAVDRSRLRIPLLIADDAIHGYSFWRGATIFPTQLGAAASFDPAAVEAMARVTAVEVSATGLHWTFSPVVCLTRDLRWGRVNETFGEDPFLLGELASAMVRGYQGDGLTDPTAVLACAKHFAGYSETQGGRDASEADISRRKLRSWFLPPFERVAREGARTFMIGYQSTDGVPIVVNKWLLQDVLRGEWGYTGTLITDWDNVGRMVWEQKIAVDPEDAAAKAVAAGNDMVMTTPSFFEGVQKAVANGRVSEEQLDAAVARILTVKFELGLFEDPRRPDPVRQAEVIGSDEHQDINLHVTRRSLVLLQNSGVLPLGGGLVSDRDGRATAPDGSAPAPLRLALVGPNADDVDAQLGDWAGRSGQVDWMREEGHPREMTETVLDGLRGLLPETWELTYAKGAEIGWLGPDPEGEFHPDGQPRMPIMHAAEPDAAMIAEAVAAAEAADHVVAVVGDTIGLMGETRSTATLDLVGGQVALLDALAATGTPMTVVVIASKPLVLPDSALAADAIVWAANPGMRGGRAIAELLLGTIDPAGRLPVTFPRHVGQQPVYYNQLRGQHGNRYADLTQDPAFAFGEGLSYSTVEYSDLTVAEPVLGRDDVVRARVTVTNTGTRPSHEVVQVYVSDLVTSLTWADKELKAYRHVDVAPGESVVVDVELPVADCTIVDAEGARVVEPGDFELLVGRSSRDRDLLRAGFTVTA